jgi:hypothetical protein
MQHFLNDCSTVFRALFFQAANNRLQVLKKTSYQMVLVEVFRIAAKAFSSSLNNL